jgi:hypothetical protein
MGKNTEFTLSDIEEERYQEFKERVKALHGKYGHFSITFSPTGIGNSVVVYSHLADLKKDITNTNW